MTTPLSILFCLFAPALVIWISTKSKLLDKIGVVTLSFSFGVSIAIILALLTFCDIKNPLVTFLNSSHWDNVQTDILHISVCLTLPLILTSFNIKNAITSAKGMLFALLLSVLSMIIICLILATLYASRIDGVWQYASLAFATYVGSGLDMAVVKSATGADESVFITMTSYDIRLSAIYVLFLLTLAVPLVRRVFDYPLQTANGALPVPSSDLKTAHVADTITDTCEHGIANDKDSDKQLHQASYDNATQYSQLLPLNAQKSNMMSLLLAGGIALVSMFLSSFVIKEFATTANFFLITTLSLLFSMSSRVNELPTSYRLGSYLLMVFCFTIGSMLDIKNLLDINMALVGFLFLFITGGFTLHLYLCKLFKIDGDSFLITSVATILSLPFVPLIVNRLRSHQLLVAGLSIAVLSDVLGTYLGIIIAYFLKWWLL